MNIKLYPDPALKVKASKITDFSKDWLSVTKEMIETMRKAGGAGLAANQVGLTDAIITLTHGYEEYIPLLNPEIIIMSNARLVSDFESCLSLPGISLKITRANHILVNYQDLNGKKQKFYCTDFTARVVQHEVDHILGKTILDRASKKNLLEIAPKIKELEEIYNTLNKVEYNGPGDSPSCVEVSTDPKALLDSYLKVSEVNPI
jgi:peptide deformylase